MVYFTSWELLNGIRNVNRVLRDMCGGEQLVRFYEMTDWIYCPRKNELSFRVQDGAPQCAIELAERVRDRWSYADLVVKIGEGLSSSTAPTLDLLWLLNLKEN